MVWPQAPGVAAGGVVRYKAWLAVPGMADPLASPGLSLASYGQGANLA